LQVMRGDDDFKGVKMNFLKTTSNHVCWWRLWNDDVMSRNLNDQNKHLFVVQHCNEWGLLSSHCLVWDWPKLLFNKLIGMQIVVFHANINSSAAQIVQILILTIWIFSFGYFLSCMGCLVCSVKSYHVLINMEWGFYICSVFAVYTHGLGVFITFAIWMVAYVMTKLTSVSRSAGRLLLNTGQMRYTLSPVFTVYKH
jgi:hypothetical protein